ncbi:hypothetical protein pmac_cds_89 [Pandoravirus macleodensis]|uniref:Uncharacterized protein n=1 Tax=Pandoravirus macleodensis TaxID=2107707 RepID=A0A2U7UEB2_9VIRU|nr:hypothetical protein pmac_cds_89 [Pandoravirus macleodensis]AVK76777.1 hypothetical protein pmac_cds_89 [Pandoravirus macleodensis]
MAMHGGGVPPDPRDNSRAGVLVHGQFVCVRCAGPLLAVGFWPLSVRFVGHSESDGGGMLLHGGAHCVVCGTQRQIVENARHNAVCAIPSDDTGPTTSGSSPQEAPPQEEAPPPPRRSIFARAHCTKTKPPVTMETAIATPVIETPVAASTTTTTTVARRNNTVYWIALGVAVAIILLIVGLWLWHRQSQKKTTA